MKTIHTTKRRRSKAKPQSGQSLEIKVVGSKEVKRFDKLLGEFHYLGESRPMGDTLRLVAQLDGQWIGLLLWGSAAYRLKDRDGFIGWTPTQRA